MNVENHEWLSFWALKVFSLADVSKFFYLFAIPKLFQLNSYWLVIEGRTWFVFDDLFIRIISVYWMKDAYLTQVRVELGMLKVFIRHLFQLPNIIFPFRKKEHIINHIPQEKSVYFDFSTSTAFLSAFPHYQHISFFFAFPQHQHNFPLFFPPFLLSSS